MGSLFVLTLMMNICKERITKEKQTKHENHDGNETEQAGEYK